MFWIRFLLECLFPPKKAVAGRRISAGSELVLKAGSGAALELHGAVEGPAVAGNNKNGIVCTWYDEATRSHREAVFHEGIVVISAQGKVAISIQGKASR